MKARARYLLTVDALRLCEMNYAAAWFIDSTERRDRERAAILSRLEALRRQVAAYEARYIHHDLFGAVDEWNR